MPPFAATPPLKPGAAMSQPRRVRVAAASQDHVPTWSQPRRVRVAATLGGLLVLSVGLLMPAHGVRAAGSAAGGGSTHASSPASAPSAGDAHEAATAHPAAADSASPVSGTHAAVDASGGDAARGRKIAFDRSLGNCLACHTMKGSDVPSNVGPELADLKSRYPDPSQLYTILYDEEQRNPQTVMPPFGKNLILTPQQIRDVIAFLYTE
jgi:sulfur-oxidizing protein SoxX